MAQPVGLRRVGRRAREEGEHLLGDGRAQICVVAQRVLDGARRRQRRRDRRRRRAPAAPPRRVNERERRVQPEAELRGRRGGELHAAVAADAEVVGRLVMQRGRGAVGRAPRRAAQLDVLHAAGVLRRVRREFAARGDRALEEGELREGPVEPRQRWSGGGGWGRRAGSGRRRSDLLEGR